MKRKIVIILSLVVLIGAGFTIYRISIQSKRIVESPEAPKSVILMIADGMGEAALDMSELYFGEDLLEEDNFLDFAWVQTSSVSLSPTDSAASATAMATGHKVENSVISKQIPGDGGDLETILEYAKMQGKSIGIITTTTLTHATPAAFSAHANSRNEYELIGEQMISLYPNILFGGGEGINEVEAGIKGYQIIHDVQELKMLDTTKNNILGIFNDSHFTYLYEDPEGRPSLKLMTEKAIEVLSQNEQGFFLMIEGGRIDHAAHGGSAILQVYETKDFLDTAEYLVETYKVNKNVQLYVTADHETGGLSYDLNAFDIEQVNWSTTGHTDQNVQFFSLHTYIESEVIHNTEIYEILLNSL